MRYLLQIQKGLVKVISHLSCLPTEMMYFPTSRNAVGTETPASLCRGFDWRASPPPKRHWLTECPADEAGGLCLSSGEHADHIQQKPGRKRHVPEPGFWAPRDIDCLLTGR